MVGYGLFESVIVFFTCLGVEKKMIISFVIFLNHIYISSSFWCYYCDFFGLLESEKKLLVILWLVELSTVTHCLSFPLKWHFFILFITFIVFSTRSQLFMIYNYLPWFMVQILSYLPYIKFSSGFFFTSCHIP